MAKFSEVMRQWRRMCDAMETTAGEGYGCDICPVNNATDTMGCGAIFDMPPETNWEGMAEKIMRWAAEHPKPAYPTWADFFYDEFLRWCQEYHPGRAKDTDAWFDYLYETTIPADIAQKLGIEPKEDA